MFYFEISVFYATIDISGEKMETKEQKQKFQQIVDESHRIVFLVVRAFLQKAEFPTSEALTVFTTRNGIMPPKKF